MANIKSLELESSSSQYASITDANQTGLDITGDISIEGWIKRESIGVLMNITHKRLLAGGFSFYIGSDNKINAYYRDSSNNLTVCTSTGTNTNTNWQHIAVTIDVLAKAFVFYVNGIVIASSNSTADATAIGTNAGPFTVGAGYNGSQTFDGLIEHARVWNDVRTEAEIRQYMFQDPATNEAGLQGWWKFDDDYTDQTSNGNDLTAVNTPVFSTDTQWTFDGTKSEIEHTVDDDTVALWHMNGALASADKKDNAEGTTSYDLTEVNTPTSVTGFDGEANGAYELNGSNEYLSFSTATGVYGDNGTIEAWIYLDVNNAFQCIYDDYVSGVNRQVFFCITNTGKINANREGATSSNATSSTTVTTGEWHYIAMTYEVGEKTKIYLDGVLDGVASLNLATPYNGASTSANIGKRATADDWYLNGKIDEVNFSTRTKSAEEIAKYYSGRVSAKFYPELDGYVARNVDNETFSTLRNSAGNGAYDTNLTTYALMSSSSTSNNYSSNNRAIILFDSSTLPDDCNILNASMMLYGSNNMSPFASDTEACVVSSSPASNTTLISSDYDINDFGTTEFSNRIQHSEYNLAEYNKIILNGDGIAHISVDGVSKFGLLTGWDFDNSAPTWISSATAAIGFSTSEVTNKPYLLVEYEALSDVNITPDTITVETIVQTPTITHYTEVTPNVITVGATVHAPMVSTSGEIFPDTISVITTLHTPTVFTGIEITPDAISVITTIHTPTQMGGLWSGRIKPDTTWGGRTKPTTSWSGRDD